jgi:hypothetical protein
MARNSSAYAGKGKRDAVTLSFYGYNYYHSGGELSNCNANRALEKRVVGRLSTNADPARRSANPVWLSLARRGCSRPTDLIGVGVLKNCQAALRHGLPSATTTTSLASMPALAFCTTAAITANLARGHRSRHSARGSGCSHRSALKATALCARRRRLVIHLLGIRVQSFHALLFFILVYADAVIRQSGLGNDCG